MPKALASECLHFVQRSLNMYQQNCVQGSLERTEIVFIPVIFNSQTPSRTPCNIIKESVLSAWELINANQNHIESKGRRYVYLQDFGNIGAMKQIVKFNGLSNSTFFRLSIISLLFWFIVFSFDIIL